MMMMPMLMMAKMTILTMPMVPMTMMMKPKCAGGDGAATVGCI